MSESIEFTREKLELLKSEYRNAVAKEYEYFAFDDNVLHTGYAKYMIEYLDSVFVDKSV